MAKNSENIYETDEFFEELHLDMNSLTKAELEAYNFIEREIFSNNKELMHYELMKLQNRTDTDISKYLIPMHYAITNTYTFTRKKEIPSPLDIQAALEEQAGFSKRELFYIYVFFDNALRTKLHKQV